MDCIKAMIIGPEGTPYQNGCFIFDIFLPADYNKTPPNVKIVTTNGGKFRYNPNLYNDGVSRRAGADRREGARKDGDWH